MLLLLVCTSTLASESAVHFSNINRAPLEDNTAFTLAGVAKFVTITNPAAIGARGNLIYLVDSSKQIIYRYNSSTENLTPLYSVNRHLVGIPNAIRVDHDGSFFLSDPFGRQILHFSMQGDLLHTYQDALNLSNPVAITLSRSGELLIADRLYDHIIVFNRVGDALRAFGERGTGKGQLLEVVDMATGPDGIYVLDRMTKSVKVFNDEGLLIRELPRQEVVEPTAIAIDYAERVYISDGFDDTIKVYDRSGLIDTFGGTGSQNGLFRSISDLHVDNNFLYVADVSNNRIQVFLLKSAFIDDNEQ